LFPDDDSNLFPNAAEEIIRVYERDEGGKIAAVCAAEALNPPHYSDRSSTCSTTKPKTRDSLKLRSTPLLRSLEAKYAPDPARLLGLKFISQTELTLWAAQSNVVPLEYMTGFRMTFRSDAIKKYKFDETFSDYSLFEDIDASFSAWNTGAVVGARNAKIFHNKSPERRGDGTVLGVTQILNKTYVIAKHSPSDTFLLQEMKRFAQFKLLQYMRAPWSAFQRQRFVGAYRAFRKINLIFLSSKADLPDTYRQCLTQCLK